MMELSFAIFYPESTSKWLAARDEGDWTRPELWFYFAKQMSLWWLIYAKWCWWGCLILCVVFSKLHIYESCSTDICIRWCKFYAAWRCKLGTDAWIWCLIFFSFLQISVDRADQHNWFPDFVSLTPWSWIFCELRSCAWKTWWKEVLPSFTCKKMHKRENAKWKN